MIAGLNRWPTLIPFVEAMVRKLDQHAPKKGERDGWQHDDPLDLMDRLHEETGELAHAVCSSPRAGVLDEAADVANMAMMVADASGAIDVTEAPTALATFDLVEHLRRQREFSAQAFGPHPRLKGVVAHIRKELEEIEAKPLDLVEWVDVVLLALDGAWRAGHGPEAIAAGIAAKQAKNEARTWPDWRRAAEDAPIEHDIPANPDRDADLIVSAAIDELAACRERIAELEAERERLASQVLKLKAAHHEILERLTDLSTALTRRHERAKKGIAELANLVMSTAREP